MQSTKRNCYVVYSKMKEFFFRMVLATDKRNIPSKLDLTENIGYTHQQESEKNLNPSLTYVRLSTCDVFESSSEESQVSDCSDTSKSWCCFD